MEVCVPGRHNKQLKRGASRVAVLSGYVSPPYVGASQQLNTNVTVSGKRGHFAQNVKSCYRRLEGSETVSMVSFLSC